MFLTIRLYRGSIRLFSGHRYPAVRFTFYPTLQRPYKDVTWIHVSMPKKFLKAISVQLMAQLTTAVVVKHTQTKIN